jgi:SHS2 domain-containing protein
MKIRYRQFDHAGDLGLEIFAPDRATLYENAALTLYDILTDFKQIKAVSPLDIQVTGANSEELLVAWLAELNFYTQSDFWLFCTFEILELADTHLSARVWGEKIDPKRHPVQLEIKAITYHQLHIIQQPEGFQARLILDI